MMGMPILPCNQMKEPVMTVFDIPDMTCDGCVRAVTNAVKAAAPQAEIRPDLPARQLRVTGAPPADVLAALRGAGFTPALREG
jgi:copper chaperone